MSKLAPGLPPPIDSVLVPDLFSVSTLMWLDRCALSVLGMTKATGTRADGILLPHPLALLGTILHHSRAEVLNGRWGGARSALDAFRGAFHTAVTSAESQIREEAWTARLVPLRTAVGRRDWMKRVEQAERWAARLDQPAAGAEPPRAIGRLLGRAVSNGVAEYSPRLGAEEPLQDAGLRLKGRPDWSEQRDADLFVVSEFKSGRIVDEDGRLLEEHTVQVQGYTLMLERAKPGARIEPYVEGADRIAVPWGGPQRERLLERLRALDARLPAGSELAAEDLATPGPHCRFCLIRPLCSRYLRDVPSWWPDRPGAVRPLPLDVWGLVELLREDRTGVSLRLTDAIGRRVLVDGVAKGSGLGGLGAGDAVWLFDLESSEDLDQHGAKVQPRNFHEDPPGPKWARATRLRSFIRR